jgi:hypothetical protein
MPGWIPYCKSGGGLVDITYANLVTAIGAETLKPGTFYRITDFATTHYIGAFDYYAKSYTRFDTNVGPTEPLIVLATARDQISEQAYSADFTQDIIIYDWNPDNWLVDPSYTDEYGVIISGWKGVIVSRHDTIADVFAPSDWRNCLTRRWKTDATAWDSGTTYEGGEIVSHGTYVYKALQASTNQVPVGPDNNYWIILRTLTTYEYWNPSPDSWMNVPSGEDYDDFLLFESGIPKSVYIAVDTSQNIYPFNSLIPNSVIYDAGSCYCTRADSGFTNNTIGPCFFDNILGPNFRNNIVGGAFGGNSIGAECQSNCIGHNFAYNIIGVCFYYNYIGSSFSPNTIYSSFSINTIGASVRNNVIGDSFGANTIGPSFRNNTILANTVGSVNFIGATHVYEPYNCEIYVDKTLGARLRYVDNNVNTIVAVTA